MKKSFRRIMFVLIPCVIGAFFYIKSKLPEIINYANRERIYLSPDKRYLAAANGYFAANLFDRTNGKHIIFKGTKEMDFWSDQVQRFILFSPDGSRLVIGGSIYDRNDYEHLKGKHSIRIWEITTRKKIRTIACNQSMGSVAIIFKNGRTLAYNNGDGSVQLLDIESGKFVRSIASLYKNAKVSSMALSPDGKYLIMAYALPKSYDKKQCGMMLWDIINQRVLWSQGLTNKPLNFDVNTVAFSPDSKTIALKGSDIQLRFYDVQNGHLIRSFNTSTYYLQEDYIHQPVCAQQIVDFSPDGKLIVTGGNQVDVWNVSDGSLRRHLNGVGPVKFASDGSFLVGEVAEPAPMFGTPDDGPTYHTKIWKFF